MFQELTGKLPKEYPLDPGEEAPTVRRKIGTAFKLDEQKILPKGEVSQSLTSDLWCFLKSDEHSSTRPFPVTCLEDSRSTLSLCVCVLPCYHE